MKKLTENLIQQRLKTCTTDLDKVLQINITGRELQDVSLLRQMTGVEILSLSVNQISSLSDFQFCKNLKELYLRNNNISDLKQISYLTALPKLKLLMLSQNPCVNDPLYRATVIKNLQHLTELDGIPISQEERQKAAKSGISLNCEPFISVEDTCEENFVKRTLTQTLSDTDKGTEEEEFDATGVVPIQEGSSTVLVKYSNEMVGEVEKCDCSVPPPNGCDMCREKEMKQPQKKETKGVKILDNIHKPSKHLVCKFCNGHTKNPLLGIRIIPKNPNLLSATLNLIKELDYSSLQVVQVELTSLMSAFEVEFVCNRML